MYFSVHSAFYAESVNTHDLVETIQRLVLILSNWLNRNKLEYVSHINPINGTLFQCFIRQVGQLGLISLQMLIILWSTRLERFDFEKQRKHSSLNITG